MRKIRAVTFTKCFFAALAMAVPAAQAAAEDSAAEREKAAVRAAFADQTRDGLIANVNGEIVTVGDLRRETQRYIPELRRSARSAEEFYAKMNELTSGAIQSLTDTCLLVSAFDDSGAVMDENYIDQRINDVIEQDFDGDRAKYLQMLRRTGSNPLADKRRLRDRIKASSWDDHLVRGALGEVSPAAVKAEYEARIEEFTSEASFEYAQIVLFAGASETDDQVGDLAEKIRGEIASGKTDFESAAKLHSRDDYRLEGGYVGWKPLTDLSEKIVPELEKTPDGGVSSVVALDAPAGKVFVLLKRIAYRPAGVIPLKDVRAQIENRIRAERVRRIRAEKMAELRDEYYIRHY